MAEPNNTRELGGERAAAAATPSSTTAPSRPAAAAQTAAADAAPLQPSSAEAAARLLPQFEPLQPPRSAEEKLADLERAVAAAAEARRALELSRAAAKASMRQKAEEIASAASALSKGLTAKLAAAELQIEALRSALERAEAVRAAAEEELKAAEGDDAAAAAPGAKLTINDLPKELLVSVFIAIKDQRCVRHTIPLVCKAWNELYRSKDASPLHETLEVDFRKEALWAAGKKAEAEKESDEDWEPASDGPFVHASRVVAWVARRAGSVRKLHLKGGVDDDLEDFSAEDLSTLVAVVGSFLTEIRIEFHSSDLLYEEPFWKALRDSVVPAGRLRSFVIRGIEHIESDIFESYVEPLGQLAGSLEVLVLETLHLEDPTFEGRELWLQRFPESLCALTELRRLVLAGHPEITAVPAEISSLKKLKDLDLACCDLFSLPRELGALSGLTRLDLSGNENLGDASPEGEAFPAELGRLKSLRVLDLHGCGLRTVPAFLGELESLKVLDLRFNDNLQIDAPLDFLLEGCSHLRAVVLEKGRRGRPWTPQSLARLEAFKARLLAKNPVANVVF